MEKSNRQPVSPVNGDLIIYLGRSFFPNDFVLVRAVHKDARGIVLGEEENKTLAIPVKMPERLWVKLGGLGPRTEIRREYKRTLSWITKGGGHFKRFTSFEVDDPRFEFNPESN